MSSSPVFGAPAPLMPDTKRGGEGTALSEDQGIKKSHAGRGQVKISAFCHVVGLGLGVWQVHESQGPLLVEAYSSALAAAPFPFVSDLSFSWFPSTCTKCGGAANGEVLALSNGNRVRIHFNRRDPAEKLPRSIFQPRRQGATGTRGRDRAHVGEGEARGTSSSSPGCSFM